MWANNCQSRLHLEINFQKCISPKLIEGQPWLFYCRLTRLLTIFFKNSPISVVIKSLCFKETACTATVCHHLTVCHMIILLQMTIVSRGLVSCDDDDNQKPKRRISNMILPCCRIGKVTWVNQQIN